ncbi:hypothetical protein CHLRE_12g503900v5 [Chlamydomonas reinhardtii]|uniref:Uncharacterized protein n=1 Tax=Chlamydomonas reinhardtii TaxID=3055 RepID=A8IJN4_CHLRE|nr:uncharacterized protein CHLRE_12g503900v5 [Chlamydomonas reinhardtii]PNW74932.1 hypothetical protein CHLRE_12g503900v5 [Chlamydomonas reinhardtii]|eukprot:XP_001690989.1 hypothetical protein CHLREDRAFT_156500 [Chlamydomonas reinhardtii]
MARVASGRAFDIENVDPATGLLSTLRNSTNGAPQLKKASATVDARAPFSELTGLFQGQSQEAPLAQAPLVFPAPAAATKDKASSSLFGCSLNGTWAPVESAPSASTSYLRKMR